MLDTVSITDAVTFLFDCIAGIISVLDTCVFTLYGFDVSLWSIMFCFLMISMVASVFWRGARG